MSDLMLALKEAEIRSEVTPVHMHQGKTATQYLQDKGKKTMVIVHAGNINETTALCLTTEEEWRHTKSEYHDIRYIKRILSGPEGNPSTPKN